MGGPPKIGVPENGWFISWKTLLKQMDDLGGVPLTPLFSEIPMFNFRGVRGRS